MLVDRHGGQASRVYSSRWTGTVDRHLEYTRAGGQARWTSTVDKLVDKPVGVVYGGICNGGISNADRGGQAGGQVHFEQ